MKSRHNMKSRTLCIAAMTLLTTLAIPIRLAAQDNQDHKQHHYKLIDIGTLGGPNSYLPPLAPYRSAIPSASLSRGGAFAGYADTSTSGDPDCLSPDCFVSHAIEWKNGCAERLGSRR